VKAEAVHALVTGLKQAGVNVVVSLPSRSTTAAICVIMNDHHFNHIPVANEADAIGVCAGAYLGGKKPVFMVEHTGVFMASCHLLHMMHAQGGIPILMIIDQRGDYGEGFGHWYYAHGLQLPRLLESFQIPYTIVRDSSKLSAEVVRGMTTAETYGKPAALLLSGEEMYND
jgi:sulfopyruvate decarboxylase subunit alpha